MLEIIIFVILSIILIFIFRSSILDFKSYSFTRFFAFEFILALLLMNARTWFVRPFAINQIISWLLLMGSLILVINGFSVLRIFGKSKGHLENTTTLVQEGAYRHIRHPLYSSLLILGWGAFFKQPSLMGVLFGVGLSICLFFTAKREEHENLLKFGEKYLEYMKDTKMFIPFLY